MKTQLLKRNYQERQPALTIALTLILFLLLMPVAMAQTGVAPAGEGTSVSPYLIATLENLVWVREQTNASTTWSNGKYFEQTADIDLISISNWTPIGSGDPGTSSAGNGFQGTYDGKNFTIRNLRINSSADYRGLFGYAWGATIKNVRIEDANVIAGSRSGILLGSSNCFSCGTSPKTEIIQVSVRGNIRAFTLTSHERIGGIVGNPAQNTEIKGQNVFVGDVAGRQDVGGLVGRASGDSELSFSYARANVTGHNVGSSNGVGIITGNASTNAGTFIEMYAEGTVTVNSGTQNKGVIGFAPNPTSSSSPSTFHTVTDLWFDNSGGIALIGNESDDWETGHTGGTPWVVITGGGGLSTSQMQGAAATINMTGTGGGRWDFSNSGAWRTVTIPENDYPVFTWQAGDLITISGNVSAANKSDLSGITVTAQVGDATFTNVTTTTAVGGSYSFNAYTEPTRRVFARTTDDDGLPIGASVEGPWTETTTNVNLDLQPRTLTISSDPNKGWVRDGNEILAVEEYAVLNVNTLRDELLNGDRVLVAGEDIIFDANLTPNLTARRTLTLKAGGDIQIVQNATIAPTGNPLDLVLWSDIDAQNGGMVWLRQYSSINTNGGHLWIGGGDGTATWNDLTVGDGYAAGSDAFIPDDNTTNWQNGYHGITLDKDVTIQTGAGNIEFNGKSGEDYAPNIGTGGEYSTNIGIYLGDGSQTATTSGNISMNGIARLTANQPTSGCSSNRCGFRYGILFHRADETSSRQMQVTSQSGNIALNGLVEDYSGGTTDYMNSGGVTLFAGTQGIVVSTDDGNIELMGENQITTPPTGRTARGVWLTSSQTDITSTSGSITIEAKLGYTTAQPLALQGNTKIGDGTTGDIEIRSNNWTGLSSSTTRFQGTGELRILPTNTSTTIGLSGASGILDLPESYFSTNFEAGFSQITIGSDDQTGNITLNNISFRDNMRLQTGGTVVVNGNQTITLPNGVRLQVDNDLQMDSGAKININDN